MELLGSRFHSLGVRCGKYLDAGGIAGFGFRVGSRRSSSLSNRAFGELEARRPIEGFFTSLGSYEGLRIVVC